MKFRIASVLLICVWLTGCAAPRIDGSSDDKFKASVDRVRTFLPEAQRAEFETAFTAVAFKNFDLMKMAALGTDAMTSDVRGAMNGKTAAEVIADYKALEAAKAEKERLAAVQEMSELAQERDASVTAKAELEKFVVERARFSKVQSSFMAEPRIDLRVKNGTSHAIARAYFHGRIVSPGRSVPWLEEDFNYPITGGLEPGEVGDWKLSPNSFSKWGSVSPPADAGLEVTVLRVDGADGKALFSVQEFTAEDQTRLAALEKLYGGKK